MSTRIGLHAIEAVSALRPRPEPGPSRGEATVSGGYFGYAAQAVPEPEPLSVDDALDRLVKQFSDAMAFFRELIQNAIDAGSEEIEIGFEHRDGRMIVRVDDWGEGMTREIIESKLTRLFSSSKDGDRTKIGKFGIGFVSVFAIEPEAISIDTSREGEHWRILFDEKRRFSLIRRDEPVEGTKIAIYKRATKAEFEQFRARALEVVRYWCRHVAADLRVDGERINAPFDLSELGVPLEVRREHDDEVLVVGHPRDGVAFAGFYNRGLTLIEEQKLPGIAFKASSPNLEHTLTRDDVIREAGFERLMTRVHALIAGELCEQVFARLDAAVREPVGEPDADQRAGLEYLWRAALHHVRAEHPLPSTCEHVFRTPSGALLTETAVRKPKRGAVIVAAHDGPLCEALERAGEIVVWLPEWSVRGRALLDAIAPRTVEIDEWCTALPPRNSEEAVRWQVLARAVALLLDDWGAKIGGVQLGHLDYPDSRVSDRVAITQAEFGEATPLVEIGALGTGLFSSRRVVVLNADHPTIRTIATLAQREPELAAYLAVKAFLLTLPAVGRDAKPGNRLDAEVAEQLAIATHDRRLMRVGVRA
jgi:Histidine kinase-, DNA gyrase B-, and HSP90-like ATPase